VAAHSDDVPRTLAHRLRRELLAMAGGLRAHDIHGPPVGAKRARHDRLGAARGAPARGGIEDHMGMKHSGRQDTISSAAEGFWLVCWRLRREVVLFPVDGELDAATPAHHLARPAAQRNAIAA